MRCAKRHLLILLIGSASPVVTDGLAMPCLPAGVRRTPAAARVRARVLCKLPAVASTATAPATQASATADDASTSHTTSRPRPTSPPSSPSPGGDFWGWWFTVPFLAPFATRRTHLVEVVPGEVWSLEQLQGAVMVHVPVRMTLLRLPSGGLLAYAPVAPTRRCIELVRQLEAEHGSVRHIVLPTVCVEHKWTAGPFSRFFADADVWVAPDQYALPLDLPLPWLGFFPRRPKPLPPTEAGTPWEGEVRHLLLGPLESNQGKFEEAAFLHLPSRTLLVTDAVVAVSPTPPPLLQQEPTPLLFHARDSTADPVADSAAARVRGWKRIVLFALFFRPAGLRVLPIADAVAAAAASPSKRLGWGGIFPFEWQPGWEASFEALLGPGGDGGGGGGGGGGGSGSGGKLFVAPGLQQIIFNRFPEEVLRWADEIAGWGFDRVVSCHFDAPVPADGASWRAAFSFLEEASMDLQQLPWAAGGAPVRFRKEDMSLLEEAEEGLVSDGTIRPRPPLVRRLLRW